MIDVCEHIVPSDATTYAILEWHDDRNPKRVKCATCDSEFEIPLGPEDDDDSDDQGEGEDDEPSAARRGDLRDFGKRIQEMVEEEASAAEVEPAAEEAPIPDHPPQDKYTETCIDCNGYGEAFTGSKVAAHELRQCVTCQGRGWIQRVDNPEPLPSPVAPTVSASGSPETSTEPPSSWQWGASG